MNRDCLECGAKLVGRTDKKYCSDFCRNAYNNRLNKDTTNLVRTINNRLRKNYRILKSLPFKEGKITISKYQLSDLGFSFGFITQLHTTRKGQAYFFIYDLGYLPINDDRYLIVKKEFGKDLLPVVPA